MLFKGFFIFTKNVVHFSVVIFVKVRYDITLLNIFTSFMLNLNNP